MARELGDQFVSNWKGKSWARPGRQILIEYHNGFFLLTEKAHELGFAPEELAKAATIFDHYAHSAESYNHAFPDLEAAAKVNEISDGQYSVQKAYSEPTTTSAIGRGRAMLEAYRATMRKE